MDFPLRVRSQDFGVVALRPVQPRAFFLPGACQEKRRPGFHPFFLQPVLFFRRPLAHIGPSGKFRQAERVPKPARRQDTAKSPAVNSRPYCAAGKGRVFRIQLVFIRQRIPVPGVFPKHIGRFLQIPRFAARIEPAGNAARHPAGPELAAGFDAVIPVFPDKDQRPARFFHFRRISGRRFKIVHKIRFPVYAAAFRLRVVSVAFSGNPCCGMFAEGDLG